MPKKKNRLDKRQKYRIIACVGYQDGIRVMVKWGETAPVKNLKSAWANLEKKHGDCLWMNVFHYETRQQLANFTKHNKPQQAQLPL